MQKRQSLNKLANLKQDTFDTAIQTNMSGKALFATSTIIAGAGLFFVGCKDDQKKQPTPAPSPDGPNPTPAHLMPTPTHVDPHFTHKGECQHNNNWVKQCPYGTEAENVGGSCSCVDACPMELRCEHAENGCCPEGEHPEEDPCFCVAGDPVPIGPSPTPVVVDPHAGKCKAGVWDWVEACPWGTEQEGSLGQHCVCVDACPEAYKSVSGSCKGGKNGCCPQGTHPENMGGSCACVTGDPE